MLESTDFHYTYAACLRLMIVHHACRAIATAWVLILLSFICALWPLWSSRLLPDSSLQCCRLSAPSGQPPAPYQGALRDAPAGKPSGWTTRTL